MLAVPSVLSQIYGVVPKPDAERAAVAIEAEVFATISKSVAAESPASIEEGTTLSSLADRPWPPATSCLKCFRLMFQVFHLNVAKGELRC
jgi:hypothetical protein